MRSIHITIVLWLIINNLFVLFLIKKINFKKYFDGYYASLKNLLKKVEKDQSLEEMLSEISNSGLNLLLRLIIILLPYFTFYIFLKNHYENFLALIMPIMGYLSIIFKKN